MLQQDELTATHAVEVGNIIVSAGSVFRVEEIRPSARFEEDVWVIRTFRVGFGQWSPSTIFKIAPYGARWKVLTGESRDVFDVK